MKGRTLLISLSLLVASTAIAQFGPPTNPVSCGTGHNSCEAHGAPCSLIQWRKIRTYVAAWACTVLPRHTTVV